MARALRIEYPGAFYHVISRGNAGDPIYKTRRDREKFVEYLATAVERFGIRIHTYCLMTDHYQLLLETPEPNLSRAIQWLNVSYAIYFNYKRNRRGHLFYGRYKSIVVDADGYLKHLSRYIHLNPLRAKMVKVAAEYEWSSYPAFIGKIAAPEWLSVSSLLGQFGGGHKSAQRKYRQFVEGVDIKTLENPANEIVSGLILGDDAFVQWIKTSFLSDRSSDPDLPQLRQLKPRCSLERLIDIVADAFGSTKEQILEKGRKNNLARDMAIYFSKAYSGKSGIEIAHRFGLRSGSAVTMRYKKAKKAIDGRAGLEQKLRLVKQRIMNN
jgi:REP element-mobilizing transposase RayT